MSSAVIIFVIIPTKAPYIGPNITAVNIVPIESIKRKGIFNNNTKNVKAKLAAIPINIINILYFNLLTILFKSRHKIIFFYSKILYRILLPIIT